MVTGLGGDGTLGTLLGDGLYAFVVAAAGMAVLVRSVLVRDDRLAWALIGADTVAWSAGDVYRTVAFSDVAVPPSPSAADASPRSSTRGSCC